LGGREGHPGYGHTREVRAVAISADGKFLATGSADRSIRLWDLPTGKELFVLNGHLEPITALAFTPDGKALISAAEEKSIKLWNTVTGKLIGPIGDPGPANEVPVLAARPDGKRFVAWVATATIETFDLETAKRAASLSAHEKPQQVTCLAFTP